MSDETVTPTGLTPNDSSPASIFKERIKQLRRTDSGMLPIIVGLIVLGGYFEIRSSTFLSAGNLTNLFIQSTVFILLGMAEIWLLLLGDIDLSVGWVAAVGAAIGAILLDTTFNWPWWAALLLAVAACTFIGWLQGVITILLKVPSFIITLGGSLFWEGIAIWLIDGQNSGGSIPIREKVLYGIVNINMSVVWTWIFTLVVVVGMSILVFTKDRARRASGLDSVSVYETFIKIGALAALAIVLALVFNTNRGTFIVLRGMPYAVPLVVVVLGIVQFRPRSHQGRSLSVRDRWQRRGGSSIWRLGKSLSPSRLRPHRVHGGHRGSRLRLRTGRHLRRYSRWHAGALRGRRRGHWWYESFRWSRKNDERHDRWTRDRHDLQRDGAHSVECVGRTHGHRSCADSRNCHRLRRASRRRQARRLVDPRAGAYCAR